MSDLIYRDKAIDVLDDFQSNVENCVGGAYAIARQQMIDIPSARPKGEWVDMGDFEQCSVCTGTRLKEFQTYYGKATWVKTDFCPNCGADMRERESE